MECMTSSQSAGISHGINVEERRIGSEEGVNGWNSSSSTNILSTSGMDHASLNGKGKDREVMNVLQSTPRRMAASKSMAHVMRSSAPPSSPRSGRSASRMKEQSTSSTVGMSSPVFGTTLSPSPAPHSSLLRGDARQKRATSSSPFPALQTDSSSPPPSSSSIAMIEQQQQPLDVAEQKQFHFQANPSEKTAILPRQPPSLPYDSTYLPLSPNGIDQVGHVLTPLQGGMPGNTEQGQKKGTFEVAKNSRAHQTGPPKKVLPGQELETHLISEVPGQKAMPWGLKATLLEKQLGGEKARTKMGTLKRTTKRDARRGKGRFNALDAVPLKMEDDVQSEMDSPNLPVIEISEANGKMEGVENNEGKVDEGGKGSEHDATLDEDRGSNQSSSEPGNDIEMKVEGSMLPYIESIMEMTNSERVQDGADVAMKSGKSQQSEFVSPIQASSLADESIQSESSHEGNLSNTRRPREAHKRLKMVGGYYRKANRARGEEGNADCESTTSARELNGGQAGTSRAASSVPEDVEEMEAVNDEGAMISSDSFQPDPSTPLKANKHSTLTGSLRRMTATPSVNTSPNKLMHVGGEVINTDPNEGGSNNEYCETCRGVGHFICCDGCPRSFHFACINPPLDIDELPSTVGDASDTWYCNVCKANRKPVEKGKGSRGTGGKKGIFGPLLKHVEEENPSIFALPQDIRNYFKGVATANDGSYVNSLMLRPIKVNKFGIVDEREPLRLKDKNGKSILCFQCGESAMPAQPLLPISPVSKPKGRPSRAAAVVANAAVTSSTTSSLSAAEEEEGKSGWRKIISCDFCNLYWHLDCLDPPLATMPSISRRWMCPNHIEHVLPSERIPKSVANSTTVQELPLPTEETIGPGKHYRTRVVNDGLIDIIPDPLDTYTGPGNEDGNGSGCGVKGGSGDKGWDNQEAMLPAYKGYPSVFGSQNNFKFKYRVPEKVIRLDFWTRAELEREKLVEAAIKEQRRKQQQNSLKDGLDMLALVANALSIENTTDEVVGQEHSSGKPMSTFQAESLIRRIIPSKLSEPTEVEDRQFVKPGEEPISLLRQSYIAGEYEREFEGVEPEDHQNRVVVDNKKKNKVTTSIKEADKVNNSLSHHSSMEETDSTKLRAIQELLAYKGKDALLRFLLE